MKNSPCAKLIRRATPSMSASPAATMAYMAPSVRPCSSCSRRSEITWGPRNGPQTPNGSERPGGAVALLDHPSRSIQERRARRQLFEDAQLAVAHLVQELGGRQAAARVDPLRQPELAVLPHERRAVAGQDDGEDGFRIGALEPRQDGPIVRLAGIEELGGDERDAGFLERRLVGDGGAATEVVVHREHRGGFHALARHVAGERMRHDLVVEGDAEGPLVAALAAELADLRM